MTTYVPQTIVGAQLVDQLAPWMTDQLAWYLDALGVPFEEIASIASDTGADDNSVVNVPGSGYVAEPYTPGYGVIFDPATCPAALLPYLGQFAGVEVPSGSDEAAARTLVTSEPGVRRGSDAAITAAITRNLTGAQTYTYIPRFRPDGVADAYWFIVIVRPSECFSPATLISDVNAVKPGGLVWALILTDGYTWAQATNTWQDETMTWAQTTTIQP